MGQIDQTPEPGQQSISIQDALAFLDRACERAGVDEARRKMMRDIFVYGEPMSQPELTPLPDVEALKMALETVQTWFNVGPERSSRLNADVLMRMRFAGYPVEGAL